MSLSHTSTPGTISAIYQKLLALDFRASAPMPTWWLGAVLGTERVNLVWVLRSRWGFCVALSELLAVGVVQRKAATGPWVL